MIRLAAVAGNNDSRIRNCRIYCCADASPARVFTQPEPLPDISGSPNTPEQSGVGPIDRGTDFIGQFFVTKRFVEKIDTFVQSSVGAGGACRIAGHV